MIKNGFTTLGILHSPFREKFGLPRQGSLAPKLSGQIHLHSPYHRQEWWRDLEGISHLWIVSWLHDQKRDRLSPTTRPPRLGGNKRISALATRSPNRPNPIGLTLTELVSIESRKETTLLHIRGHDLLDQTPILDIKPYLPEADCPKGPVSLGWIEQQEHESFQTEWSELALRQLQDFNLGSNFKENIEELLRFDMRPRFEQERDHFVFALDDIDIIVTENLQAKQRTFKIAELKKIKN